MTDHKPLPEGEMLDASASAAFAAYNHDAGKCWFNLPPHRKDDWRAVVRALRATPKPLDGEAEMLLRRIAELEALVYVPGLWRCPKCNFQLMQARIRASDGAVGTRDDPGEKCPNCATPLWRVTERQAGNDLADQLRDAIVRALSTQKEATEDWRPISEAGEFEIVLAYAPPENLYEKPDGRPGQLRYTSRHNWTWATHYLPIKLPPFPAKASLRIVKD